VVGGRFVDWFLEKAIFIPLLPFLGFVLITFFSKTLKDRWSGNLSAILTGLAAFMGLMVLFTMIGKGPGYVYEESFEVFNLNPQIERAANTENQIASGGTGNNSAEHDATPWYLAFVNKGNGHLVLSAELSETRHDEAHGEAGGDAHGGGAKLDINPDFDRQITAVRYGVRIDKMAAIMLLMVTIACFMIHLYSVGYMHGDSLFPRFHAFICLFTAAMIAHTITSSLLFMYMFWEIMGLCSYLLIGFWFTKKSVMDACKKAFITTRIGDVGFFLGIVMTFMIVGSFDFSEIWRQFPVGASGAESSILPWITAAGICLFMGTIGKSAQFPLQVWLPDAMEGPTPVSAMIHAAAMVSAGVYMLGRVFPIVAASATTLLIVAIIGGFTALIAALLGTVMNDIKKVLAYSTISQLGYMVLGIGAGGWVGAMFHLISHAFFKGCLFLGSGSVIIGCHHQQDMRYMGAVRKYMPITFITFAMATSALVALPFASGWFSKDEILVSVFDRAMDGQAVYWVLFVFGELAAFITAFYMTRLFAMTFLGDKYRGDEAPHDEHDDEHHAPHGALPKESPFNMTIPLIVLGTLGLLWGFTGIPGVFPWFQTFVQDGLFAHPHMPHINWFVLILSTFMGLAGVGVGWMIFVSKSTAFAGISARFIWLKTLLVNKYYMDDLYTGMLSPLIVRNVEDTKLSLARIFFIFDQYVIDFAVNAVAALTKFFALLSGWFDKTVVDGLVNAAGLMWIAINWVIRRVQSGYIQTYIFVILLSTVLALVIGLFGNVAGIQDWIDLNPSKMR